MVAASREFICVRPQTYESKDEAKVLSYVYAGRSGLENTSFALLDPKGKKIGRGARSPKMLYDTPEAFAADLVKVAAKYAKRGGKDEPEALPVVRDLRLALNVAAADMRPLVIVRGADAKAAATLAETAATFAWSEGIVGRAHYVVLSEEASYEGLEPPLGVSVVQPDPYGLGGKVLKSVAPKARQSELDSKLGKVIRAYEVEAREHSDHIREARRKGIDWESELTVTDTAGKRKR